MIIGYFTGNNPLLWHNLHLITPTALLHADRVRNYGFPGIYCKFCTHIRHWRAIARIFFSALPPQTYFPFFLFKFLFKWWYFFKIKLLFLGWKTFQYFDLSFFRYFASIPQKMYHIKEQYDSPSYIDSRESSYISRVRFAASKPIKQLGNLTQSAPGFRCNRAAVRLQ